MRGSLKITVSLLLYVDFVQAKRGRGGGRGGNGTFIFVGDFEGWESVFFVLATLIVACLFKCCWDCYVSGLADNKEEDGKEPEESAENILLEDQ
ncbi:Oidioi.mRNA.OKI2018_I69.chr2.g4960.t1.cds [Oikopleura dioica]|uniref:Oidioi.mRNA.OKI2018_I69.chr2.g4960.t1.cds n=1 Tax=Oikopleura dioica TaxID=34765 RepID=A0ABN7T2P5_OIKDI|nr:Oidioi.mRNA.OKI2018_I69.chr2.g4960.t1.cds [Oikopleura dioica]